MRHVTNRKRKVITINLTQHFLERLDSLAKRLGKTRSDLVRTALALLLETSPPTTTEKPKTQVKISHLKRLATGKTLYATYCKNCGTVHKTTTTPPTDTTPHYRCCKNPQIEMIVIVPSKSTLRRIVEKLNELEEVAIQCEKGDVDMCHEVIKQIRELREEITRQLP